MEAYGIPRFAVKAGCSDPSRGLHPGNARSRLLFVACATVPSVYDACSRHLRIVGLCARIAICCAALCVFPGNTGASDAQADESSSTGRPDAAPPPPTQASEPPPSTDQPYVPPDDAMDDEDDYLVRYVDGRLTVDVVNMPLEDLLMELGRQSGARVRVEGLDNRTVTDAFTRLSLDAALRRLVAEKNFSLTYAEQRDPNGNLVETRLKELNVYGGTGSVSTNRPSSSVADPSRPTAAGLGAPPSPPAPTPGGHENRKPPITPRKNEKVEPAEDRDLAGTPEAEPPAPPAFANPVTEAILGKHPAPVEEPPQLEETSPAPEEIAPFPEEFPPPQQELEGEPAVEDVWDPEVQVDDGEVHDEATLEEEEYQ